MVDLSTVSIMASKSAKLNAREKLSILFKISIRIAVGFTPLTCNKISTFSDIFLKFHGVKLRIYHEIINFIDCLIYDSISAIAFSISANASLITSSTSPPICVAIAIEFIREIWVIPSEV